MPVSVDIVLPCYNPGDKWPLELISFYESAKELYTINFILVNDGTKGNKIETQLLELKSKDINLTYLNYPENKGKGYALRHGIHAATSNIVLYTDIDFPFTNQSTLDILQKLTTENYDVAVGHRNEAYYQKKMSGFRIWLSKSFRFLIEHVFNMSITDTQCGLKGFNRLGKEKFLATTINRYLFDFEFIYTVCKDKQLNIVPVEVQLKENVVFSKMRLKILFQESVNLMSILMFK
jgi:glycosyltransferase involved in cell wall biosynthesis